MALSDAQQQAVHDALVNSSGGYYYKTDAIINVIRSEIATAIASLAAGNISFPGQPAWNAFVTLVNVSREQNGEAPLTVDIDEAEIAKTLAPLIAEHIRTLDQATLAQFATAATDEVARRLSQK